MDPIHSVSNSVPNSLSQLHEGSSANPSSREDSQLPDALERVNHEDGRHHDGALPAESEAGRDGFSESRRFQSSSSSWRPELEFRGRRHRDLATIPSIPSIGQNRIWMPPQSTETTHSRNTGDTLLTDSGQHVFLSDPDSTESLARPLELGPVPSPKRHFYRKPTLWQRSVHKFGLRASLQSFELGGDGENCPASSHSTKTESEEQDTSNCARNGNGMRHDIDNGHDPRTPPAEEEVERGSVPTHGAPRLLPYIVVGVLDNDGHVSREVLMGIRQPESLFCHIQYAAKSLRYWPVRCCSLNRVAGFGIYRCNAAGNYHTIVNASPMLVGQLKELWKDYSSGQPDHDDRWLAWIEREFNRGSRRPQDGHYGISLTLKWSPLKFICYGGFSVLLSFIIGMTYTYSNFSRGPSEMDKVAIAQTAWTLSSYIVTVAGVLTAIVAAVTQIGNP